MITIKKFNESTESSPSIQEVIDEYNKVRKRESELQFQLQEYYAPIVDKLFEEKNKTGLMSLLDEIPDSLAKMMVYQSLRELED